MINDVLELNEEIVQNHDEEDSSEPEGDQDIHPQQLPDDDDCDDSTNPLKNPVVLAELFELCELSDLYRFRLVSKQWHSLSLARCRREMELNIYSHTYWVNFSQRRQGQGQLHWAQTREELGVVGNKPFKSVVIHGLEIRSEFDELEEQQLYSHFWDTYGQWISKLELSHPEIYSIDALEKLIFVDTPNLQELKLAVPEISTEASLENEEENEDVAIVQPNLKCLSVRFLFKTSWEFFFLHFPNIQRLELSEVGNHLHITPLVDTLEELGQNGASPILIKELILNKINSQKFPFNGVKRLLQLPQLKLTLLHFDIWGCEGLEAEMSILPMVLHLHGETLKELRILDYLNNPDSGNRNRPTYRDMGPYSSFPFQSETYLALTELHLEYAINHNLHFLKQFPNLNIFRMIQYVGERMLSKTKWEILANFKLIHLEEFKFFVTHPDFDDDFDNQSCYYIPEEVMERFVKLMPNVKHLSAQVKTAGLRVICQKWRELRKLELHDVKGFIDDEGLTGMKKGDEDVERLPNVADLRYLRQFSVIGEVNIGELSVNTFLQMPFLHTLNLSLSCGVHDSTYKTLVKRFPNGNISRCPFHPKMTKKPSLSEGDEIKSAETDESQSADSD